MAKSKAGRDRPAATTWVHVFEEDTAEGAVYRHEDDNIPLSRRPRERLRLAADGSARLLVPGPDDRYVEQPGAEVVIVDRSPTRLVVQVRRGASPDPDTERQRKR